MKRERWPKGSTVSYLTKRETGLMRQMELGSAPTHKESWCKNLSPRCTPKFHPSDYFQSGVGPNTPWWCEGGCSLHTGGASALVERDTSCRDATSNTMKNWPSSSCLPTGIATFPSISRLWESTSWGRLVFSEKLTNPLSVDGLFKTEVIVMNSSFAYQDQRNL